MEALPRAAVAPRAPRSGGVARARPHLQQRLLLSVAQPGSHLLEVALAGVRSDGGGLRHRELAQRAHLGRREAPLVRGEGVGGESGGHQGLRWKWSRYSTRISQKEHDRFSRCRSRRYRRPRNHIASHPSHPTNARRSRRPSALFIGLPKATHGTRSTKQRRPTRSQSANQPAVHSRQKRKVGKRAKQAVICVPRCQRACAHSYTHQTPTK